jgi:GGDEF domain-containing protein
VVLCGKKLVVHASVGIRFSEPLGTIDGAELLRDADAAMYTAKRRGNGTSQVFAPRRAPVLSGAATSSS